MSTDTLCVIDIGVELTKKWSHIWDHNRNPVKSNMILVYLDNYWLDDRWSRREGRMEEGHLAADAPEGTLGTSKQVYTWQYIVF